MPTSTLNCDRRELYLRLVPQGEQDFDRPEVRCQMAAAIAEKMEPSIPGSENYMSAAVDDEELMFFLDWYSTYPRLEFASLRTEDIKLITLSEDTERKLRQILNEIQVCGSPLIVKENEGRRI